MYSSKHPIAVIGGCDPAVTFRPQPLSSSELVDAFCVIILLVFLCFNDFPGSSLDIFSWLIACFASHFPANSGGGLLPEGFAVATLPLMSDPDVTETRLDLCASLTAGCASVSRGWRSSWRLSSPDTHPRGQPCTSTQGHTVRHHLLRLKYLSHR